MNINILDPAIDKRWDDFVAGQKDSTIFHTAAWARVIRESYGYTPRYYAAVDGDNRIYAAVPCFQIKSRLTGNRLVCLPFSDSCCPLGSEADIVLLLNQMKKEIQSGAASYLEIRGLPQGVTAGQSGLLGREYHLLFILDLEPGPDVLNEKFHDNVRRGIRQAAKRGVKVRMTREEADLELFYKLHVLTRKKLGVLPQPYAFFKALFQHVILPGLGFIGLAESEGKVIAGVIFLNHKDTIYYKFNASDEDELQKRPNHLITWEAIRQACGNKLKYLDLGRCSPDEEGLRTFKTRWGAKEISLPYYYYPRITGVTAVAENSTRYKAMRLFSRLAPRFAFESAGALLYKHLG